MHFGTRHDEGVIASKQVMTKIWQLFAKPISYF